MKPTYVINLSNFPQFRFEWHPETKNLYLIRLNTMTPIGECIAKKVPTSVAAQEAVMIFMRGYRVGNEVRIGITPQKSDNDILINPGESDAIPKAS